MPATATDRLYGLTTSIAVKGPCRVATTANITLSGLQTIDGVTVVADDRVLVKDQTDATKNGIYYANTSAWSRTPDFDGARDAVNGTLVIVREGATNKRSVWELTTADPVVIGTSALTFEAAILEDAATVQFLQAGTGAVTRDSQDKMRGVVDSEDFDLVGDGSDESSKLLNAMNRAVSRGVPLELDGTKTFTINTEMTFPAGLRMRTNGATFTTDLNTTADTYLITIGDGTVIDELNVSIPNLTRRRDRCVLLDGDDIHVGKIALNSDAQQANTASADGALQILTGARNWVGLIRVTNWDRAVVIGATSKTTIGRIEVSSYVRGVYLYDNTDLHIQSGKVSTASVNASGTAGHNGVLMGCNSTDAQRDVCIENFVVEDAAEHGWRVGGPEQQSKLRFSNCSAYNCGGNGFKVLGTDAGVPTAMNRDITIDNFIAEDCGKDAGLAANNRSGMLLKFCRDVQVSSPIVRKRNQAYSAQYGITLDGVDFVQINSPLLGDAQFDGLYLFSGDGDCDYVQVNGGLAYANGRYGIQVYVSTGLTCRRPTIDGLSLDSNVGNGFNVETAGTGVIVNGVLRARCVSNAGAGACNSSNVVLQVSSSNAEVVATPLAGITARNGSWFDDGLTLNIRKAGAWAAL